MVKKDNKKIAELGKNELVSIQSLEVNDGQVVGIPKNPRYLKGEEHDKLKKSLKESPELLRYKPLMVYATDTSYIVICGNMRLRICQELHNEGIEGFDALPCFVLNKDVPIAKIKEYAIKDNVQAGNWDWDELANGDWEVEDLQDWGLECSFLGNDSEENADIDALFEDAQNTEDKPKEIKLSVHIPQELEPKLDEIKEVIKAAISEYEGVELK
jgi:hypothetical protein